MAVPTILVLGASGLVGSELRRRLATRKLPHAACPREGCDITSPGEVARAIAESGAGVVINCAAYNAVDRAESEPDEAMRVNRDGAASVARAAREAGALVVHYSTDFVYDGESGEPRPEGPPSPRSAYARSKAAGDAAVAEANPRHLVLRVGNLYGRAGRNFGSTLLARLRQGDRVRADGERLVQPTWAGALAEQTLALALSPEVPPGLYHALCHGHTTWADFARELARRAGLPPDVVEAAPTDSFRAPAARPRLSILENRALAALGLDRMPDWQEALGDYLEDVARESSNT